MNKTLFALLVSSFCFAGVENVFAGTIFESSQGNTPRVPASTLRASPNAYHLTDPRKQANSRMSFKPRRQPSRASQKKQDTPFDFLLKAAADARNIELKNQKYSSEKKRIAAKVQDLVKKAQISAQKPQKEKKTTWVLNGTLWRQTVTKGCPAIKPKNPEKFYFLNGKFIASNEIPTATEVITATVVKK